MEHIAKVYNRLVGANVKVPGRPVPTRSLDTLVSHNLVAVLEQLLPPLSSTVQVPHAEDEFGRVLIDSLIASGYGIQRVSIDLGANLLKYERRVQTLGEPRTAVGSRARDKPIRVTDSRVSYLISVGELELARDYRLDASGRSAPISPLQISGTRAAVVLDDSAFTSLASGHDEVSTAVYKAPSAQSTGAPAISLITPTVVDQEAQRTRADPTALALNANQVEVANRFYGTGAFGAITEEYVAINTLAVIFPNDSVRLGSQGKQAIRRLVKHFQERTDMISLVGCSNGYTALPLGNEGLALGRSSRVSEELLTLGIGREHILDEGCWAPTNAGDRFPSRGVVIDLLRRRDA